MLTHIHTHTHTHTHKHRNPEYIQCMWKVTCSSWNPGVNLLRAHFQHLNKDQTEIHVKWHRTTKVLGKKTYYHLYANEQVKPNPPESVSEVITWIEIISNKSMMHIDTRIMTLRHTLGIFNECWLFPPQKIYYPWPTEEQCWAKPKITHFQEAFLTFMIWNKVSKRHWSRKYFTTTHVPPHKNTPTEWLCSMNINYYGVSEFQSFQLRKIPFSSTNT
jgi:hypothetical protein